VDNNQELPTVFAFRLSDTQSRNVYLYGALRLVLTTNVLRILVLTLVLFLATLLYKGYYYRYSRT